MLPDSKSSPLHICRCSSFVISWPRSGWSSGRAKARCSDLLLCGSSQIWVPLEDPTKSPEKQSVQFSISGQPTFVSLCLGVSWEWAKQLRLILHFEPGRYYTELEARWLITMDTNQLRWTTINLIWGLHGPLEDLRQCMGQVDWIIAFGHNLAAKVPDCARIRKDLERRPRDEVVVIGDFAILYQYHTLAYSLLLDYSRSCIWHIQDLVSDVYIWLFCVYSCNHVYEYMFCIYVFQNALLPTYNTYNCLHSSRKGLVPLGRLPQRVVGGSRESTQILIGRTSYVPHFLLESWSS